MSGQLRGRSDHESLGRAAVIGATCALLVWIAGAPPIRAQVSPPPLPRITGVSHIALYVHDLAASKAFYEQLLGFEEQFRLTTATGAPDLAFIKISDRQWIELLPEGQPAADRLAQVALAVDDAEAMRAYLESRGVTVPARLAPNRVGNLSFHVDDPDGHVLEFVQLLPAGRTARDAGLHLPASRIATRLKHIGFSVGSVESSLAFYRDVLGCAETWRGSSNGQQLSWVNLRVPDGDEYVELMLYAQPPTLAQLGPMNHMSLEVASVATARETLAVRATAAAYRLPMEPKTGINRKRQLNLFDPDGTRVELMEPGTIDGLPAASSSAPPPVRSTPIPPEQ